MSYYDPRIYNYLNLNSEDQIIVQQMVYLVDAVKLSKEAYDTEINTSYLEKIFNETAVEVIDKIIQLMINAIIEFIVNRIDTYDSDIEEIDTDNYLYGIK